MMSLHPSINLPDLSGLAWQALCVFECNLVLVPGDAVAHLSREVWRRRRNWVLPEEMGVMWGMPRKDRLNG